MQEWTDPELRQRLSARQYEVLSLVARHLSSKEIAARLGLSYKTIDNHVADLLIRLGVSSRADAARIFLDISTHRERTPSISGGLDEAPFPSPDKGRPGEVAHGENVGLSPDRQTAFSSWLKLPPVGGSRHTLTLARRVAAMGQVGLVSIVILAAIVTVMVGILNLLSR